MNFSNNTGCEPLATCEPVQRPSLAEAVVKTDSVLADCMDQASTIVRFLVNEDSPLPVPAKDPCCLADQAYRSCERVTMLLEMLLRIRAALGVQ